MTDDKSVLINKMINYIQENIIYNTEIIDVLYKSNIFIMTRYKTFITNLIILLLSKDNLLKFKF